MKPDRAEMDAAIERAETFLDTCVHSMDLVNESFSKRKSFRNASVEFALSLIAKFVSDCTNKVFGEPFSTVTNFMAESMKKMKMSDEALFNGDIWNIMLLHIKVLYMLLSEEVKDIEDLPEEPVNRSKRIKFLRILLRDLKNIEDAVISATAELEAVAAFQMAISRYKSELAFALNLRTGLEIAKKLRKNKDSVALFFKDPETFTKEERKTLSSELEKMTKYSD